MRPDFASCGSDFLNHSADLYSQYVYHGPVMGSLATKATPVLVTLQGCKDLCGTGRFLSALSPSPSFCQSHMTRSKNYMV